MPTPRECLEEAQHQVWLIESALATLSEAELAKLKWWAPSKQGTWHICDQYHDGEVVLPRCHFSLKVDKSKLTPFKPKDAVECKSCTTRVRDRS